MEIWKDIEGYEGYYQVSDSGEIRSLTREIEGKNNTTRVRQGRRIKPYIKDRGYMSVELQRNRTRKKHFVHRLVAKAFVPGYKDGLVVNHIDENPSNNNWENLEWVTQKENLNHGDARKRNSASHFRAVICIDAQSMEMKRYESFTAARNNGYDWDKIRRCCNDYFQMYRGKYWRYENEKHRKEAMSSKEARFARFVGLYNAL